MISFRKKPADPTPPPDDATDNRFEQIRKQAADAHKKSDADSSRRRARQTAEDNRLL